MESGNSAELLGKAGDTPHTPPKIDIEHENSELVQMIFLFQGCILRFQPLIFQTITSTAFVQPEPFYWMFFIRNELNDNG